MDKPHRGTIVDAMVIEIGDKKVVFGFTKDNPIYPDGTDIRTSYIVAINGDEYETRNSIYTVKLGEQN